MAQTNADLIWKIADLFARPVSAQSVRRCDLAVHHPAPLGLHPGADQGPSPRRVQEGAEPEDRPRCCAQVHVQAPPGGGAGHRICHSAKYGGGRGGLYGAGGGGSGGTASTSDPWDGGDGGTLSERV